MLSSSRPLSRNGYTYHRDLEKGIGSPPTRPAAIARRCLPTKKGRWALIILCGLVTMYHFSTLGEHEGPHEHGPRKKGNRYQDTDVEEILDEHIRAHPPGPPPKEGWGKYFDLPFGRDSRHGSPVEDTEAEGPRIGSGGVPPSQQDQSQFHIPIERPSDPLQLLAWIEPMHPDLSTLPSPSEMFPEIKLPDHLKPPPYDPYPTDRLREIISPAPPDSQVSKPWKISKKSFANEWVPPDKWNDPQTLKKVQWDGFAGGRDRWENESERKIREERREAVKRGFAYGWQAYKDRAWGHDEVRPVSSSISDPFNGWGASIIDTLGTLLIMGLSDEYNLCRPHINQLNFHWNNGRDSSKGYISPESTDGEDSAQQWSLPRDRGTNLPVFETSIRYLGGMLSAYDLSGDSILLERSVELADTLSKAFNTESGIPIGRLDPGAEGDHRMGSVSIAEAGSMSLDFIRLSQVTGDRKYFDLVQRVMDYLEIRVIPRSVIKPLIPLSFQPDAGLNNQMSGTFAWGGMGDSYYEYLIKTYKLLGGSQVAQQWRRIYEDSIDAAKRNLYEDIDYIPDHPILAIGKIEHGRYRPEIEHLTCFAGGMLGIGAKLLDRPDDMADAEKISASCYWVSQNSPLGLQAEHVQFYMDEKEEVWEDVDASGSRAHPWVNPATINDAEIDRMHQDRSGVWRWNADQKPVLEADGGSKKDETPETVKRLRGVMPGIKAAGARYINRPETVESLYYMYRLTGDRKWQEKGWKMFVSWMTTSKVAGGFSSVDDVTKKVPKYGDNMESFTFAELFKYHYLLQSDPELISLDDYVFNTEAHPFLANRDLAPGSQRFWTPPPDPSANLGVKGQGTDVQKWQRQQVLWRGRQPLNPPNPPSPDALVGHQGGGGGRGMGGGGGQPGYIPPLPPGFAH